MSANSLLEAPSFRVGSHQFTLTTDCKTCKYGSLCPSGYQSKQQARADGCRHYIEKVEEP